MRVVTINGQNHKGSTYHIGRMLADRLAAEGELTEFFLPRDLNHCCVGCYACIEDEERCPFFLEKKKFLDAMEQADLLIFTTPNYCMAPSAAMKTFIDLFFDIWMSHRPKAWMFKKKAVVISTAAGMGANKAWENTTLESMIGRTCLFMVFSIVSGQQQTSERRDNRAIHLPDGTQYDLVVFHRVADYSGRFRSFVPLFTQSILLSPKLDFSRVLLGEGW